jgi:hypothetical protein
MLVSQKSVSDKQSAEKEENNTENTLSCTLEIIAEHMYIIFQLNVSFKIR